MKKSNPFRKSLLLIITTVYLYFKHVILFAFSREFRGTLSEPAQFEGKLLLVFSISILIFSLFFKAVGVNAYFYVAEFTYWGSLVGFSFFVDIVWMIFACFFVEFMEGGKFEPLWD